MQFIKKVNKLFWTSSRFGICVSLGLVFCIFVFYNLQFSFANDDLWFAAILQNRQENIIQYLIYRYFNWTSRITIEFCLPLVCQNFPVFVFLNSFAFTLAVYSICQLCDKRPYCSMFIIVAALFLIIDSSIYLSAGPCAVSLNYV